MLKLLIGLLIVFFFAWLGLFLLWCFNKDLVTITKDKDGNQQKNYEDTKGFLAGWIVCAALMVIDIAYILYKY